MVVCRGGLRLVDGSADFFPRLVEVFIKGSVGPFRFYFGVRQRFFGIVFSLLGGLMGLFPGVLVLSGGTGGEGEGQCEGGGQFHNVIESKLSANHGKRVRIWGCSRSHRRMPASKDTSLVP